VARGGELVVGWIAGWLKSQGDGGTQSGLDGQCGWV